MKLPLIERDIPWSKIGNIGVRWKLMSFNYRAPKSWEEYLAYEKEYWSFNDPKLQRMKLYFGKENTIENFFIKTKKGYEKHVEMSSYWHSICRSGDILYVKLIQPNVIAISKDYKINPKNYYEIWSKRKFLLGVFPKEFCCEFYSIGYVERDPLYPKDYGTVSHRLGIEKDKNEKLNFNLEKNQIQISDALFEIY